MVGQLYKYLPKEYVPDVLDQGILLFRNLTYFRQCEGMVRGDVFEGIHEDNPSTGIVLNNFTQNFQLSGKYSILNSTNQNLIFVFCLSKKYDAGFLEKFSCDACLEISDHFEFIRRVRMKIMQLLSINRKVGLLSKSIDYYSPSSSVFFDITDPRDIVFCKNKLYEWQDEFRICFGTRNAFNLETKIVQPNYDPLYDEVLTGRCDSKIIKIGSIRDIARIIT